MVDSWQKKFVEIVVVKIAFMANFGSKLVIKKSCHLESNLLWPKKAKKQLNKNW